MPTTAALAAKPVVAPTRPLREAGPAPGGPPDRGRAIPESYGVDRVVALVRDPQWIFCYWELTGKRLSSLRATRGAAFVDSCAWVLRLHRLSEGLAVDVEVEASAGNWYIHVGKPGLYQVELGLLSGQDEFVSLAASQAISTPAETVSARTDEEWRLKKEQEEALFQRLLKELGLTEDARRRGVSGFVGASGLPSSWPVASWRLPGSFLGGSGAWSGALGASGGAVGASGGALGASASGRPVSAEWVSSFLGASGRPTSAGSGGFMDVGWIVGADGRHEAVLLRPTHVGGPNWNLQRYLPSRRGGMGAGQRLPRVVTGVAPPAPTWPPPTEPVGHPGVGEMAAAPAVVPWVHPEPVALGPAPGVAQPPSAVSTQAGAPGPHRPSRRPSARRARR